MESFKSIPFEATTSNGRWKLPPLFKKEIFWQIGFDGESLIMNFGKVGGKVRVSETLVKPKGKRTLQEQALLEAKSRYKNKLTVDRYRENIEEDLEVSPEPMLANKWEPGKKLPSYFLMQPKIDGIRMLCQRNGEIIGYSRRNNTFTYVEHITETLDPIFDELPEGSILDGELYSNELTFEEISGIARRTVNRHNNARFLEYYIFDVIIPDMTFTERYALLQRLDLPSKVHLVPNEEGSSEKDVLEAMDKYLEYGFEGIIIRKDLPYKSGRSSNLLKFKLTEDMEVPVIDVVDGKGQEKGLALLVIDFNGHKITVRPSFPFETRREWFENPGFIIGKEVTIKYQELTRKGIPRFIGIIAVRDYE